MEHSEITALIPVFTRNLSDQQLRQIYVTTKTNLWNIQESLLEVGTEIPTIIDPVALLWITLALRGQ